MEQSTHYFYTFPIVIGDHYSSISQGLNYSFSTPQILNAVPASLSNISVDHPDAIDHPKPLIALSEQRPGTIDRIALASVEGITFIKLNEVVRLEADGNYSTWILRSGERHCISQSLKDFEEQLPTASFFRAHQSHLICRDAVCKYLREEGGMLLMCDKARIPVARRRKEALLAWLKGEK